MFPFEMYARPLCEGISTFQARTGNAIVVYTAVTGHYDKIHPVYIPTPNTDYICLTTDPSLQAEGWTIFRIGFDYLDPRRLAKVFKVLPHLFYPAYTYSIWVDANIAIKTDLSPLRERYLKKTANGIALFRHAKRNCAYREATECLRWGKDCGATIRAQMACYKLCGYPDNHGLIAGRVILREHHVEDVKCLMAAWWQEIEAFSVRDQLSFNYCAWMLDKPFAYIPSDDFARYFSVRPHKRHLFHGTSARERLRARLGGACLTLATLRDRLVRPSR